MQQLKSPDNEVMEIRLLNYDHELNLISELS